MKKENSNLLCWWSQSEISQKERAERNVVEQKPHSLSQGSERMKQIQISDTDMSSSVTTSVFLVYKKKRK